MCVCFGGSSFSSSFILIKQQQQKPVNDTTRFRSEIDPVSKPIVVCFLFACLLLCKRPISIQSTESFC